MFFDDRLATVLRQRATSEAGARTQFRQLLDILGNRKFAPTDDRSAALVAAAWLRMDALAEEISASDRAAMVREPGWRFRSADLAAHLADQDPEVASAALNRVQLSTDDWAALIPRLPVRARGFLRLRRDLPVDTEQLLERLGVHDRGLPSPIANAAIDEAKRPSADKSPDRPKSDNGATASKGDVSQDPPPIQPPAPGFDPADPGRSEISALVERIAQFRRTRDTSQADLERSPRLPLDDHHAFSERRIAAFGFSTDASGKIDWAENEVAAMVIGTRLSRRSTIGAADGASQIDRAFERRQPIIEAPHNLRGAPAIEGQWFVDARPLFGGDGGFSGYIGRFRRQVDADSLANSPAAREADRIRQLLHELRTPVTAVQGYAEVIQQQLFGPAPHEYRALAAAIAADAARILAGFEELDRLAKLETGALSMEEGEVDLASLILATNAQLSQVLGTRMAGIEFEVPPRPPVIIPIDRDDLESLLWRLMATLGGNCASGEMLMANLETKHGEAILTCELPAQLMAEEDVFSAEARPVAASVNAGLFGAGFALRLARAEARAAKGSLTVSDDTVTLTLPLLTNEEALPSQTNKDAAGDAA